MTGDCDEITAAINCHASDRMCAALPSLSAAGWTPWVSECESWRKTTALLVAVLMSDDVRAR